MGCDGLVHLILAISVVVAFSKTKYTNKSLFPFSVLILTTFAVLRYQYGNDYNSYFRSYLSIRNGGYNPFEDEILFSFLNNIIPSYYFLVAIISIFYLLVISNLIKKNMQGIYAGLGMLIFVINPYLFLMNLSAMRQCIAMCIFVVAIKYLYERRLIKYMLLILLATGFHTSALILIPVYFFINGKQMNKIQTVVLITGVLILMFESAFVSQMIEIGLNFFDNSDYTHHFSQDMQNSLRATILTGVSFTYVVINLTNLKGYRLVCGKLYLIGLLFGLLAYYYSMFTRVQMYFDIFSIVALPAIIEYHICNTRTKWARVVQVYLFPCAILSIYLARYYTFFTNPMWKSFGMYHTIFEAIL